jgi:hypothetical protein
MADPRTRTAPPRSIKWRLIEQLEDDLQNAEDDEVAVAIGEMLTALKDQARVRFRRGRSGSPAPRASRKAALQVTRVAVTLARR